MSSHGCESLELCMVVIWNTDLVNKNEWQARCAVARACLTDNAG